MPAPRELARFEHILDSARYTLRKIRGADVSVIADDIDTRSAVFYHLVVIGEAANHLFDALKSANLHIHWREVVGLRNVMAHEYFGVDYDSVWLTLTEDLPTLPAAIEQVIAEYSKED